MTKPTTMEYIKIDTLNGDTFEGFKINHPKYLPKAAILHIYAYSIDYSIMYAIYRVYNKKGSKTFIHFTI